MVIRGSLSERVVDEDHTPQIKDVKSSISVPKRALRAPNILFVAIIEKANNNQSGYRNSFPQI